MYIKILFRYLFVNYFFKVFFFFLQDFIYLSLSLYLYLYTHMLNFGYVYALQKTTMNLYVLNSALRINYLKAHTY